jgi:hypothetical protein
VSDDGFDGGAAAQLALDDTEDAALLAGDEDTTGIFCVVATVSLIDIGPLDRAATPRMTASPSMTNCLCRFFSADSTMSGYRLVRSSPFFEDSRTRSLSHETIRR